MKVFMVLGTLNAFLSIALGAFGAHGLKDKLSAKYLDIYQTGVHYHMIHALGLVIVGILYMTLNKNQPVLMTWTGWLMFAGIVLFSGSLYVLSLTKVSVLGAITPLGGLCFLASWLLLTIAIIKA
ncbi:DUF423 domain-containing protein [Pullulanibacillus sp. KACC 23026]|uniref:DUF423 domain-containing protein n=1 Tax=Pullulanibacillus sp. KACC 23026 TaxID=3028315 RepID=UPI0023B04B88|nr:DUF423 domain-containing protein [Pullulanibacillus sp. KACC 23026]WEG13055.1 DUF423 domain-containing protein [Pullulanibacillus sp. KACC 23026]